MRNHKFLESQISHSRSVWPLRLFGSGIRGQWQLKRIEYAHGCMSNWGHRFQIWGYIWLYKNWRMTWPRRPYKFHINFYIGDWDRQASYALVAAGQYGHCIAPLVYVNDCVWFPVRWKHVSNCVEGQKLCPITRPVTLAIVVGCDAFMSVITDIISYQELAETYTIARWYVWLNHHRAMKRNLE